jgi:type I restriction enzyme S subunit
VVSGVAHQQVPEGYQQTEVGVIPDDWKCIESGEAVNYFGGYGFSSRLATSSGIRWLKIANVGLNEIKWDAESFLPEQLSSDFKSYELKPDDVVMALTRPILRDKLKVSKIGVGDAPALLNQRVARLDAKSFHQIDFLYYVVQRLNFVAAMNLSMAGTDPPNIGTVALGKIKIALPSDKKEQTAIANALSDVDTLITSLEKLIAKKRAIKTAAMQQLLTGKKRLPPFDQTHTGYKQTELGEIPEDWGVDSIGSVLSITTGDKNTQDKINDGQYPFFVRSETIERINSYSFDGEAVLTAGDGVGTGKIYHYIDGKFDYHQRVYLMHNFCDRLDGYFFYIYFSNNFYDRIMSMTAKSSVDSVRREMIADMMIALPPIDEQIKISKVLTDMGNELDVLVHRLNKTQLIKQGMMQELLTGRIRLVKPNSIMNNLNLI